MTVLIGDDPALPESLTAEEEAAMESYEGMVYRLSVALMRLDGNDGDPHHLIWEGGPVPEPWGDVWQRYEPQALSVIDSIGEASARAMVDALTKAPMPVDRIAMLWNSLPLETDAQSVVAFVRAVENFHGIAPGAGRCDAQDDAARVLGYLQADEAEIRASKANSVWADTMARAADLLKARLL